MADTTVNTFCPWLYSNNYLSGVNSSFLGNNNFLFNPFLGSGLLNPNEIFNGNFGLGGNYGFGNNYNLGNFSGGYPTIDPAAQRKEAIQQHNADIKAKQEEIKKQKADKQKLQKELNKQTKGDKKPNWGKVIGKGAWNGFLNATLGLFTDKDKNGNRHFSLGKTLLTVGVAAAAIALDVVTCGAATPFLVYGGMALGAYQAGKGAVDLCNAKTDEDREKAVEGITEGTITGVTSAFGLKALKNARIEQTVRIGEEIAGITEKDGVLTGAITGLKNKGTNFTNAIDTLKTINKKGITEVVDVLEKLKGNSISVDDAINALKGLKSNTDPKVLEELQAMLEATNGKPGQFRKVLNELKSLENEDDALTGLTKITTAASKSKGSFLKNIKNTLISEAKFNEQINALEGIKTNLSGDKATKIEAVIKNIKTLLNTDSKKEAIKVLKEAQELLSGLKGKEYTGAKLLLTRVKNEINPDLLTSVQNFSLRDIDLVGIAKNTVTKPIEYVKRAKNPLTDIRSLTLTANSAALMQEEAERKEILIAKIDELKEKIAEVDGNYKNGKDELRTLVIQLAVYYDNIKDIDSKSTEQLLKEISAASSQEK